jgi:hypothetical protein
MIRTEAEALEFVRKHGVVTMTASSRPSLIEAIVGGPVKGSWWSHPKGRLIFKLADAVHDSKDVLTLKLVDGKVTFLHRSLWPALARVVDDQESRRGLSPSAKRLLARVERSGSLRLDEAGSRGRKELESTLLVHSGSMHTEKGSHATVLTSWRKMFDADTLKRSRRLTLPEAREILGLASVP